LIVGEREAVGRFGEAVEVALGADRVPPAGHQHQLASAPRRNELPCTRGEFLDSILRHEAGAAAAFQNILAAQVRREQHQPRRPGMIGDVLPDKFSPARRL
jgi:hypothetical protein